MMRQRSWRSSVGTAATWMLLMLSMEDGAQAFTPIAPPTTKRPLPQKKSQASLAFRPRTRSSQRRSPFATTRLHWSPLDEQGPAVGPTNDFTKMLMSIGTSVEVTRAMLMGNSDQLMQHLTNAATNFFHELPFLTVVAFCVGCAWDALSHPPADYRHDKAPPGPVGLYDPEQAKLYYQKHPLLVLQRLAQVLHLSYPFLLGLLRDKYEGVEAANRPQRAQELLQLCTALGPTAIKIGQALSVRPDLIPEEFSDALATLQDQVPPFDSARARRILKEELGDETYARLTQDQGGAFHQPIASASIGQVYKVNVLDGKRKKKTVAVKIQRPNVHAEIALDLFLCREILVPLYKHVTQSGTDLASLANEWGRGFLAELDYRQEAHNTAQFNQDMGARNMDQVVCAPTVVPQYSTSKVLVTEWVEGTRIDQASHHAADIPRLCSVALNAYLIMLLELSSLHCDPHPGNLLVTKDGKLVILDFGMTLAIDPSLQYSLLEYVAHLTADDYDQLPTDLTNLGFLKADKLEFAKRSGVLEPLKYFLQQVGQGGGAQRFRHRIMTEYRQKYPGLSEEELRQAMRQEMQRHVETVAERESISTGITMQVEELQRQNRDAFQIPSWFVYTSRAFLTLEGVSLQANPEYSLIKSCFPYVAKRLVGDDDPRAQQALKELLYTKQQSSGVVDTTATPLDGGAVAGADAEEEEPILDLQRVSDLVHGFSSYSSATKSTQQQGSTEQLQQGGLASLMSSSSTNNSEQKTKAPAAKTTRREKLAQTQAALDLAKDSADLLLAPGGNMIQNLLVHQSALATSAKVKDDLDRVALQGPQRLRQAAVPFGLGKLLLPPLPLEQAVQQQLQPFVRKTKAEHNAQVLAQQVSKQLLASTSSGTASVVDGEGMEKGEEMPSPIPSLAARQRILTQLRDVEPEQAALVLKEVRQTAKQYGPRIGQLGHKFASTLLQTASRNIESTLQRQQSQNGMDGLLRFTAKGLSKLAQHGAAAITKNAPKTATTEKGTTTTTRRQQPLPEQPRKE